MKRKRNSSYSFIYSSFAFSHSSYLRCLASLFSDSASFSSFLLVIFFLFCLFLSFSSSYSFFFSYFSTYSFSFFLFFFFCSFFFLFSSSSPYSLLTPLFTFSVFPPPSSSSFADFPLSLESSLPFDLYNAFLRVHDLKILS